MAAHVSCINEAGNILTITAHPVVGLDNKPYIEHRLEERDALGNFVGYCAMGSLEFCRKAMLTRVAAAAICPICHETGDHSLACPTRWYR